MASKTEYYTGADCTGSNGDAERTLTISNTGTTTDNGFLVNVSGLTLSITSEFTVSHKSTNTVITFANKLWDSQTIVIEYVQQITGSGATIDSDDFSKGPLSDFGVEVTRTPVTMTTNHSGNKTYTDGTNETIDVVFMNPSKKHNLDKAGLTEVYDAKVFTKADQTINKYDKITYDSRVYRVESVSIRHFSATSMFKRVLLFFIEDE